MKAATLYDALGISQDATPAQIKAAYRKQAAKHHPDHGGDVEAFRWIKQAYDVLSDPKKRKRYDETGETENHRDRDTLKAINKILALVPEAFAGGHPDPVRWIAERIDDERNRHKRDVATIEAAIRRMQTSLEKFRERKPTKNAANHALIVEAVEASLILARQDADTAREQIELAEKKLGMLDGLFESGGPTVWRGSFVVTADQRKHFLP